MPIDLLRTLSQFEVSNDRETDSAFFRTHVPWVAPEAYLHIIYKPSLSSLLVNIANKLRIPAVLVDFLTRQNGARLFSGSLFIFGVVRAGQLLTRSAPFSLPPLNIEAENSEPAKYSRSRFLAFGAYGFDGSVLCIDRLDERVILFHRDNNTPIAVWQSLDDCVLSEISRLCVLFDRRGKMLVDESKTIPSKLRAIQ